MDETLPVDLSKPEDLDYVVSHMKENGARLVGINPEDNITREIAAPIYLLLKIMEEVDSEKVGRAAAA